ncbi:hypothetical protein Dimus_039253 [Dionaea muscipula]
MMVSSVMHSPAPMHSPTVSCSKMFSPVMDSSEILCSVVDLAGEEEAEDDDDDSGDGGGSATVLGGRPRWRCSARQMVVLRGSGVKLERWSGGSGSARQVFGRS